MKKPSLDKILLKNYRPISNLPFLSKILIKVVLHKLLSHLLENNLSNPFQSAYRAGHSTETVLLRIVNDILFALDNDNISVLPLLDLSAAFDTIDHQILLSRLNSVFGIQSTALQWFQSEHIKYKVACMCFSAISGSGPAYLSELLHVYTPSRTLRSSSDTRMLEIQQYKRKTHGFRTFSCFGPHIRNSLAQDLRHCSTLSSFKAKLKTFLFSQHFHPNISTQFLLQSLCLCACVCV